MARSRFAFLDWFEGIVVSGEEQLINPHPTIFHRLLTRYEIAAPRAVYIDDSSRNVFAVADAGFHAPRFVGAHRLRRDLRGSRMNTPSEALPHDRKQAILIRLRTRGPVFATRVALDNHFSFSGDASPLRPEHNLLFLTSQVSA